MMIDRMFQKWGVHRPVWYRDSGDTRYPILRDELKVDAVVVGGGIVGVSTALELVRSGIKVAIVTEGRIAGGASGNSTAHLTAIPDMSLKEIKASCGDDARLAILGLKTGLAQIAAHVAQSRIVCNFQKASAFHFAETKEQADRLEEEYQAAIDLGIECNSLKKLDLDFSIAHAIEYPDQAQMNPLLYLYGLSRQFVQEGGLIFEDSRVVNIQDGPVCEATTEYGRIRAENLILATNSPVGVYLSLHTRVAPYFTYAIAVRLKRHAPEGLFWDSSNPYFYFRSMTIEDRKMLIVGGCDHKTGQEENTIGRYQCLENFVRERFDVTDICHYWGNEIYESVDGLPYIGRIPRTKNLWTATGFSGTGLTYGSLSATILADLILARENHFSRLYDPARVRMTASVGRFTKENLNVARWMMADWLSRDEHSYVREIPNDSGRVIEGPFQKVAIYKDDRGEIHAFSPVCGHLGGIVHWNEAEKSWDCPCHGSRYNCKGKVISGPSMNDLEAIYLNEDSAGADSLASIDSRDLPSNWFRPPHLWSDGFA